MSMGVILWKKNAQQNEIELVTDVVLFYRYLDTWILNPDDTRLKKNMSLPIPLCGSNLRKDLQLTAASTQQLTRYQTVRVRALPAAFLETPSYSSICISWGFARHQTCDISTRIAMHIRAWLMHLCFMVWNMPEGRSNFLFNTICSQMISPKESDKDS